MARKTQTKKTTAKKATKKRTTTKKVASKNAPSKNAGPTPAEAPAPNSPIPKGVKTVDVLSKVNMNLNDGTELLIGERCTITESEAVRLEDDARGPFFTRC